MDEILFITPLELSKNTILGGNVEPEKYNFCVEHAQLTYIEPLLGSLLYNKLSLDFKNNELTGLYEVLMNDLVKPILLNQSIAEYIEISPYVLNNGGLFKHTPNNVENVEISEVQYLSSKSRTNADKYIGRFNDWIAKNKLPEYTNNQDGINPIDVTSNSGWFFD